MEKGLSVSIEYHLNENSDSQLIRFPGQCLGPTLFSYKNHVYKNVEAQITLKFKNVVVILLVAIPISC